MTRWLSILLFTACLAPQVVTAQARLTRILTRPFYARISNIDTGEAGWRWGIDGAVAFESSSATEAQIGGSFHKPYEDSYQVSAYVAPLYYWDRFTGLGGWYTSLRLGYTWGTSGASHGIGSAVLIGGSVGSRFRITEILGGDLGLLYSVFLNPTNGAGAETGRRVSMTTMYAGLTIAP